MYPPAPVTNTRDMEVSLSFEIYWQFAEPRLLAVLLRENCFSLPDWPGNPQIRIVPKHASVVFRRVVVRHLVNDLGIRFQRAESMREPDGNKKLVPVGGTDDARHVLPIRRASLSQVNRHVKDRSPDHAHELDLGERRNLEMKPAHHAALHGKRMVVLDELEFRPQRLQPR